MRALGDHGERLNPRKADLEAWRQAFAQALRDRGVEAEATPRRARGVNLTGALVEACPYLPSVNTVKRTTAGMQEAFAEAGGVARTHEPRIDGMTHYTNAFLIERLSVLLAKHGRLSRAIVEGDPDTPGSTVYQRRFGGLRTAYALAGYDRTPGQLCHDAQRARWDPILAQRRAASLGGSGPDESAIVSRPQPDDDKELGR